MKNTTRIGIVLGISFAFFCAEITGEPSSVWTRPLRSSSSLPGILVGFKTKSLALIADAVRQRTTPFAMFPCLPIDVNHSSTISTYKTVANTLVLIFYIHKPRFNVYFQTVKFTFAFHRAELVGAFFNGVFLLALALSIFLQSIERFVHVEVIDDPFLVLVIGCVGLGLNIISALAVHDHHGHGGHGHDQPIPTIVSEPSTTADSLRDHIHATHNHTIDPPVTVHQHNLGLAGVLVHLLGDAVNNIGVIIAAIIMWKVPSDKSHYADPAASLAISLIIFTSAIPMTLKSGRILLEAAPLYLDLAKVREDLLAIPDVLSVHDLHVWHLSQSVILASLHVCVPTGTSLEQWEQIERTLQHCFQAYGISHVTISPELQRSEAQSLNDLLVYTGGCSRLSSQDDFGCAVSELKKRRLMGGV
ncbi:Zinc/cadmium resistance protein [Leucoagaricus sp. SymC.cos]|nr:Zinc/cadmium resistance protein [Leucoagaricus sp. SymC.cos]